ncbi:hypothetical protein GCM10011396_46160 [Undibacterium terreum]|uniref:Uncharacterized protein n=1 Tax=Undibacterium terreum TaxID=1224302 RepID=A0A916UYX3_9BURK|nr:hypothetical protein GCM10011396_46160 [Undibacterium terreum]
MCIHSPNKTYLARALTDNNGTRQKRLWIRPNGTLDVIVDANGSNGMCSGNRTYNKDLVPTQLADCHW